MNLISTHSLCSVFVRNYSLKCFWMWCHKLGTPIFVEFGPLLFAAPLKFHLVVPEVSVHSHFQISPEMFSEIHSFFLQTWRLEFTPKSSKSHPTWEFCFIGNTCSFILAIDMMCKCDCDHGRWTFIHKVCKRSKVLSWCNEQLLFISFTFCVLLYWSFQNLTMTVFVTESVRFFFPTKLKFKRLFLS